MRLKLLLCSILFFLVFPLQANALTATTGTESADLMMLKKDQIRERKQETREAIQAKKDEFKLRLQTIRDQKKKLIVEKLDTKLATVNRNAVARFTSVLEKLQAILNRIIGKANTPSFNAATASAQLAINNATAIVASQSAMVYVIQIASEFALKTNVGSSASELRLDLRDARKAIVDAKQAVMNAVKELAKDRKNGSSATGSAQ
ncbi:MAG: hypothetical protein A3D74_04365 [Candidatus Levybacteria bacterium RIFCSPHIGHO2_02_FULL_37_13]|nr:MAG: hypothetical protein A3D74_04365 [Candidatus Levybacteria bacterium RIFCSPHIGHO2_02_FULL_37_13]OGH30607.1 MAG: hypothetical protein A3E40_01660 [Candidatus Levybacteria bacterium RIFCSPHIGHO2_12_FULL_37_9]